MKIVYKLLSDFNFMLDDEVEKLFMIADTNENEMIDYNEFISATSNIA
jgi:Ca2+-binding EF-hand superfamily protein